MARADLAASVPLQDVLRPDGPQAQHILGLWHLALGVCTVVFVAVLVAVALALWRAPRGTPDTAADLSSMSAPEPRNHRSVLTASVASALLLVFLIVASV